MDDAHFVEIIHKPFVHPVPEQLSQITRIDLKCLGQQRQRDGRSIVWIGNTILDTFIIQSTEMQIMVISKFYLYEHPIHHSI